MRSSTPRCWCSSGGLAERHRRDRSFLLGRRCCSRAASAACAAASSVETLVAFRVAQAAGAALMTPTSLGLLLAAFPPERRGAARFGPGRAIGGLGAALGPLVGGLLVTARLAFDLSRQRPDRAGRLAGRLVEACPVPGHEVPRPKAFDAALVTGGIGALTFAIVKVNDWGWKSRGHRLEPGRRRSRCLALVRLALPRIAESVHRSRAVPHSPVHRRGAGDGALFGGLRRHALSIALWEQTAWGWSALKTGLAIAPGPLMVPITSLLFAGRLIARFGAAPSSPRASSSSPAGLVSWALPIGPEPNVAVVVARHDSDRHRRRADLPDLDGRQRVGAAAVLVRDRLRRHQHDPSGGAGGGGGEVSSPSSVRPLRWKPAPLHFIWAGGSPAAVVMLGLIPAFTLVRARRTK